MPLPPGFASFPYANPDAPAGGRLNLAFLGAFDSLAGLSGDELVAQRYEKFSKMGSFTS